MIRVADEGGSETRRYTGGGAIAMIRVADCLPLALWTHDARIGALVHCGWRGVADGIVVATLAALEARGVRREELRGWIGPHLRRERFEIGPEVAARFPAWSHVAGRDDRRLLDLESVVRAQLDGVAIDTLALCTLERPDMFHSFRADGASAGRNWIALRLAESPAI